MVKLKFIIKDNSLVLRISEGKERYYKSVKHLLTGSPNLAKHWNADKERFSANAVSYSENNKALEEFKSTYTKLLFEHPELTARQVASYFQPIKQVGIIAPQKPTEETTEDSEFNFVEKYLEEIIVREKAKQGCNFETYSKLLSKCRKIIKGFSSLTFQSLDYKTCVRLAHTFAKYDGYKGTTKAFRNLLGKASKDHKVPFSLTQIGDFVFADYNPKKHCVDDRKPDVLTTEQLKQFLNADLKTFTPTYKDRKQVELYHDFCVFMFHSFFAPCDVIKLKYSDITRANTIRVKRKKTHQPVEVPVSPAMANIIAKYKGQTVDGYVFPIMDDKKEAAYTTADYLFKKFREKLNIWLKCVGKELGLDYNLYAYVFRHTAITIALDSGLPISYVAMAAGTSIEMIQEHYYNGDSIINQQKLQMAFMKAAM